MRKAVGFKQHASKFNKARNKTRRINTPRQIPRGGRRL